MGSVKLKHMKTMHIINSNTVWGRLSGNYLTQIYRTKNILTQNRCDLQYIDKMIVSLCLAVNRAACALWKIYMYVARAMLNRVCVLSELVLYSVFTLLYIRPGKVHL